MKVLEEVVRCQRKEVLFRFASYRADDEFLSGEEMDSEQISEMKEFLGSRGMSHSLENFINAPFERKRQFGKSGFYKTRFSDGSFPVVYFALKPETAEAEVRYHFCEKFSGKPSGNRIAWYYCFICDFQGFMKDLRPMQTKWPDLMHPDDYEFCNRLGAEAVSENLDGLLAPSVRKSGGINVPAFAKRALRNPRKHSLVQIRCNVTYDIKAD